MAVVLSPVARLAGRCAEMMSQNFQQRFWDKVCASDEAACWDWRGGRTKKGYGWVATPIGSRSAHRVAAFLSGMIVDLQSPQHILHRCDNPPCCNPSHLFLGNNADNVADRVAKGRSGSSPRHGESNRMAKLSLEEVYAIRRLANINLSQSEIAKAYGVRQPAISRIISGQRWGGVL